MQSEENIEWNTGGINAYLSKHYNDEDDSDADF